MAFSKLSFLALLGQFQRCVLVIGNNTYSKHLSKNCNPNLKKFKRVVMARRLSNYINKRLVCLKKVKTTASSFAV